MKRDRIGASAMPREQRAGNPDMQVGAAMWSTMNCGGAPDAECFAASACWNDRQADHVMMLNAVC